MAGLRLCRWACEVVTNSNYGDVAVALQCNLNECVGDGKNCQIFDATKKSRCDVPKCAIRVSSVKGNS